MRLATQRTNAYLSLEDRGLNFQYFANYYRCECGGNHVECYTSLVLGLLRDSNMVVCESYLT